MVRLHMQMNLRMSSTDLVILAPYYGELEAGTGMKEEDFYNQKFKCVWLLHGLGGNCNDWVNYTQVETFAEEKNCFVICPSGGAGFYTDGPLGTNWETLIMEDIWNYLHRLFPMMSEEPKDNVIAGLSMGGYGAMKYALSHSGKFGYGCSLSGGLNMPQRYAEGENINGRLQFAFGKPEDVEGGPFDLYQLAKDLKRDGGPIPRIYISCGRKDWEYEPNQQFRDFMREQGYDVTWDEDDYSHEWRMWNLQIKKVLDFGIPGDFCKAVFTRGHVEE